MAVKKYKTQVEVMEAIGRLCFLEEKAEAKRDRCRYESPEYWRWHDLAIKYREKAQDLMPTAKRFIYAK